MNNHEDHMDACPFPPDGQPPAKKLTTNALDIVDSLFKGWRNYLILVSVMALVLAYSIVMVPPPLISGSVTPRTWNKTVNFPTPAFDNYDWLEIGESDRNYTDQVLLDGSMVLEFKNQVVNFSDIVLVKDNAKIILRNSTLLVPNSPSYTPDDLYHEFVGMLFEGYARLEAYDSVIIPNDYMSRVGFIGRSSCYLENTLVAKGIIALDESASLETHNSSIMYLFADGSASMRVYDTEIWYLQQYKYWRTYWENPSKNVDSTLLLTDSKVTNIQLRIVNASRCTVTSPIGFQENWNIYDAFNLDGATMNVTLKRSELSQPLNLYVINSLVNASNEDIDFLMASNSDVKFRESDVRMLNLYTNSSLSISDSNIDSLTTGSYSVYESFLDDVTINDFHQELALNSSRIQSMNLGSNCVVTFNRTYVDDASVGGEAELSGSVNWGDINFTSRSLYNRLAFTQIFKVCAQGQSRMLPGVDLVLMDENGDEVWRGTTDVKGEAFFNLTFCQYYPLNEPYQYVTNYKNTWVLTGTHGDETETAEVKFLNTGSPITLSYETDAFTLPVDNEALLQISLAMILILTIFKIGSYLS